MKKSKIKHQTLPFFFSSRVAVHLVGVGGTGSQVLSGLIKLHMAMLAYGHPAGLFVQAYDPDIVTEANIGRQLFYPAEVGLNKAIAIVNRSNMGFALHWQAVPEKFNNDQALDNSIIISCVDTRRSRSEINRISRSLNSYYLIDCGNAADYGQVLIGNNEELPHPYDIAPDLINTRKKESTVPSCSLAEALNSQHLYVNQWVATAALQFLWDLFKGGLDYHATYLNLKSRKVVSTPILKQKKC